MNEIILCLSTIIAIMIWIFILMSSGKDELREIKDGTPKDNNMNYCPNCGARMGKEALNDDPKDETDSF